MKKPLWALDFGAERVVALVAEKKSDGSWHLLGGGDAKSRGRDKGEWVHLGDAVESVVEAIRKAERASGAKCEKLYYNFDDAAMEGVRSRGSKTLNGEGQIQQADICQVEEMARRLIGHFEKGIAYSCSLHYVIDDRDQVLNPLGIFGRKLEVETLAFLTRSRHAETWKNLMKRSQVSQGVPIFSALSTAYGVLPAKARMKKTLIWDLGRDFLSGFIFENSQIQDYQARISEGLDMEVLARSVREASLDWATSHGGISEMVLTGDLAGEDHWLDGLSALGGWPVRQGVSLNISKLDQPAYASVVGLLEVAEEMQSQGAVLGSKAHLLSQLKEKTVSFLDDYF